MFLLAGIVFKNAGVDYLKENAAVRFENVKEWGSSRL
jgi:hypothetical protein